MQLVDQGSAQILPNGGYAAAKACAPENPGTDSGKALLRNSAIDFRFSVVMAVHPPPYTRAQGASESCIDNHGNTAGVENGLVASNTNITKACRSVEPLIETCIGTSAP